MRSIDPETHKQLKKVKFFVEADDYARHSLWTEYCTKSIENERKPPDELDHCIDWEHDHDGFVLEIDHVTIKRKHWPICVSFQFAWLNDVYVCFYSATSMVIHHGIIEKFMKDNYPVKYDKRSRFAYTNATNFHHCVCYCKEEWNKRYKLNEHEHV